MNISETPLAPGPLLLGTKLAGKKYRTTCNANVDDATGVCVCVCTYVSAMLRAKPRVCVCVRVNFPCTKTQGKFMALDHASRTQAHRRTDISLGAQFPTQPAHVSARVRVCVRV